MSDPKKPHVVRAADLAKTPARSFSHPFNPKSEIHGHSLGDAVGLARIGVHLVRIPPGKESFVFHTHYSEEEFVYVLSGRAIAEIGDDEIEIGAGDFLGFSTPSVGHHLRNPFDQDLVYLTGGERHAMEIADYPKHGKRMVRVGRRVSIHSLAEGEAFPGLEPLDASASETEAGEAAKAAVANSGKRSSS